MKIILIHFTDNIPLGLAYLSAVVKGMQDVEGCIVNCEENSHCQASFLEAIRQEKPDVIGVTVYTFQVNTIFSFLRAVKKMDQAILTVVGGPHPTALPEETARVAFVDVVVCGEGGEHFQVVDRPRQKQAGLQRSGWNCICAKWECDRQQIKGAYSRPSALDTLPLLMWQDLPMNANILTKHLLTVRKRVGRRGHAKTVSRSAWMRFYP